MVKTLESGKIFDDRYEIECLIGSGGSSDVYKAWESKLNRSVAIKLLQGWADSVDANAMSRFQREAKVLCKLQHPNIIDVYRFGLTESGIPFLVSEYIQGESLRTLIEQEKTISYPKVLSIALDLALGLAYAHSSGVIHRDLKPENVIIDSFTDKKPVLKLIDFGLCKADTNQSQTQQSTLTGTGELLGTAAYMSPEQILGQKVDERTDIYSFGCILFEMITGKQPLEGRNQSEMLMRRVNETIPRILKLNPDCKLPAELDELIQSCCARAAEKRVQSFEEIITLLKSIPAPQAELSFAPAKTEFIDEKKRQNKIVLFSSLVIATIITLAILLKMQPQLTHFSELPPTSINKSLSTIQQSLNVKHLEEARQQAEVQVHGEDFKRWPAQQKGDLLYSYFDLFRKAGDDKSAKHYASLFLKTMLLDMNTTHEESSDWPARVRALSNYFLKARLSKANWRELNLALLTVHQDRSFVCSQPSYVLLRELQEEAILASSTSPNTEIYRLYAESMVGLSEDAAPYSNPELHKRFSAKAWSVVRKQGFKHLECLLYQTACQFYTAHNNLEQAKKEMLQCKKSLADLEQDPNARDLRLSTIAQIYRVDSKLEAALAKQSLEKGDKLSSRKYEENSKAALAKANELYGIHNSSPTLTNMVKSDLE